MIFRNRSLYKSVITLAIAMSCTSVFSQQSNLDSALPPSKNFDLNSWSISIPSDEDGNGRADTVNEIDLSNGYVNPSYFYTNAHGGMTFRAPINGVKTSKNTKYVRTELREMLRRGDKQYSTKGVGPNNWVLSSAPLSEQKKAGAVDGKLTGTVAVDHVTTTGEKGKVGRVVFAQIHAKKDVPVRLFYRKLPNNSKGSLYMSHEPSGEKDIYFDLIGSRSSNLTNPDDGVLLGEKFSYEITVQGNRLNVSIMRQGHETVTQTVDMSNSGYDQAEQYVYFKAGAYLQDNTANDDDYAQVSYYALQNSH